MARGEAIATILAILDEDLESKSLDKFLLCGLGKLSLSRSCLVDHERPDS